MISILVANSKGGSGKTTIATNLAAAFAVAGRRVLLADGDRQHSSSQWSRRRPETCPPILAVDWSKDPGKVPKGIDVLVIDSPAALGRGTTEDLAGIADRVIVPVMPSPFDEGATAIFLKRLIGSKALRKRRQSVAVVGNRVRLGTRAAQRLDQFLADCGVSALTRLRDSQVYPDCATAGLGLFDLKDRRATDYRAEWGPLLAFADPAPAAVKKAKSA